MNGASSAHTSFGLWQEHHLAELKLTSKKIKKIVRYLRRSRTIILYGKEKGKGKILEEGLFWLLVLLILRSKFAPASISLVLAILFIKIKNASVSCWFFVNLLG